MAWQDRPSRGHGIERGALAGLRQHPAPSERVGDTRQDQRAHGQLGAGRRHRRCRGAHGKRGTDRGSKGSRPGGRRRLAYCLPDLGRQPGGDHPLPPFGQDPFEDRKALQGGVGERALRLDHFQKVGAVGIALPEAPVDQPHRPAAARHVLGIGGLERAARAVAALVDVARKVRKRADRGEDRDEVEVEIGGGLVQVHQTFGLDGQRASELALNRLCDRPEDRIDDGVDHAVDPAEALYGLG